MMKARNTATAVAAMFLLAGTFACTAPTDEQSDDEAADTSEAALTQPVAGAVRLPAGVSLRLPIAAGVTAKITNAYGAGFHVGVDSPSSMNQHYALDIYPLPNGGYGLPALAAAGGVVRRAGWAPGGWSTCGQWVVIEHDFGDGHRYLSNYCHLSAIGVAVGQRVSAGQQIGKIGCSSDLGNACSRWEPHLHFSMQRDAQLAGGSYGGRATVPEVMGGYSNFRTGMLVTGNGSGGGGSPTPTPKPVAPTGCGTMTAGQGLTAGKSIASCDGRFMLVMQTDSNLVLYKQGTAIWQAPTYGTGATIALMQSDGNFVAYGNYSDAKWATGTNGNAGSKIVVQNDGNLVVYRADGRAIWASNTNGR